MADLTLTPIDHATARISAEPGVLAELSDTLSFKSPGADFDPRYRKGRWDGMIRLVNSKKRTVPVGLSSRVKEFCVDRGYSFSIADSSRSFFSSDSSTPLSVLKEFVESVGLPEELVVRDYQLEALAKATSSGRQLFLSPTSSGKSLIIYLVTRWYARKTLVIVPTVGLVGQMTTDFESYGSQLTVHKIKDGKDHISADVVVSTWQSIYEMPSEWFDQFGLIIGDEAHLFAAKSLTGIMNKAVRCGLRFGFTGTLNGTKIHQLQLEGLFGPTTVVTTTKELMNDDHVAQLSVKCVVLSHPERGRRELTALVDRARASPKYKKMMTPALTYMKESQFVAACVPRNRFIVKMATRLQGNVLVLFHLLEQGDALYDSLVSETNRPVHLVNGGVDGLERNEIRKLVDESDDAILVASAGTTSTGVSIRRINHMILASPRKSRIVTLQSIGRGLRRAHDKTDVTIYDVADDLTRNGKQNYSLRHLAERVKIYEEEGFEYTVSRVDLSY